jgi:processing peptidase subunit alpha
LEEEFPGSQPARPSSLPKPVTKVTALPNGVKVASLDNGDKAACFGLLLDSGSREEAIPEYGSTLVLKRLAFKSTQERSAIRLNRDLQDVGITVSCTAGREKMLYSAESLPQFSGMAMKALTETVMTPYVRPWEVKAIKEKIVEGIDLADFNADPAAMLYEAIHAAAFDPISPLGHPLFVHCELPPEAYQGLLEFRVAPQRITIAGSGVSHDELLSHAESLLGELGVGSGKQVALTSPFIGGEQRVHITSGANTHLALAFQGPAVGDNDAAVYMVLDRLLDAHAKAAHPTLKAMTVSYSDAGIVALTGVDTPLNVGSLAQSMVNVVSHLASNPPSAEDLHAAIASARLHLLTSTTTPKAMMSALALGAKGGSKVTVQGLEEVSGQAILGAASKLVKGKIALAAIGDMRSVPRLDVVKKMF